MTKETVVVVAGGGPPAAGAADALPEGATVIAADGGLGHARALGLAVRVAVGDFDSARPADVAAAQADGVEVVRHPAEKDATDLELALDAALALAPERVLVLAGGGGRLDHLLAVLLLLGSSRYAAVEVDALLGRARVHVVRDERTLAGEPGELLSLLALHGPAEGVSTHGLAYPLRRETLEPGSTRGVSNVFANPEARISLERGVLLAVRPGPEEGA
ncbi:MAG TPA: thiamine diphosphokinase [Gaiellaceae bacterium]|nr:thiamine diphosphokinase [Gaiellaceae bacterium]